MLAAGKKTDFHLPVYAQDGLFITSLNKDIFDYCNKDPRRVKLALQLEVITKNKAGKDVKSVKELQLKHTGDNTYSCSGTFDEIGEFKGTNRINDKIKISYFRPDKGEEVAEFTKVVQYTNGYTALLSSCYKITDNNIVTVDWTLGKIVLNLREVFNGYTDSIGNKVSARTIPCDSSGTDVSKFTLTVDVIKKNGKKFAATPTTVTLKKASSTAWNGHQFEGTLEVNANKGEHFDLIETTSKTATTLTIKKYDYAIDFTDNTLNPSVKKTMTIQKTLE